MNEHMKLLFDLNKMWIPDSGKDIKWVVSQHDDTYFAECVKYLKSLGVHNVLDIACGDGHFINKCIHHEIDGYGIEPRHKLSLSPHINLRQQGRIVHGTFENFITFYKNVWRWKPSSEVKFDCITIHNTVHGLGRPDRNTLIDLLSIMRKHL